jgi:hypothetical protein
VRVRAAGLVTPLGCRRSAEDEEEEEVKAKEEVEEDEF